MSQREEQQRHLDCLNAELAETCAKAREIRHDRDITKAWLDGWDAHNTDAVTAAINRLATYQPLASKAVGPVGLALSEDGAPEQDGAPPAECWDYL